MRQWMNIINEAIEPSKDKTTDWYTFTGADAKPDNIKKLVQKHWGKVPTIAGDKITIDGKEIGTYTNGSATLKYKITDTGTQLTEPPAKSFTAEAMVDSLPEQETKTTYTLHINGEAKLSMEDYEALIDLIHELHQDNHDLKIDIKEKIVPRDSTYEGQLTETIRRVDGKYRLVSKSGKNLGTYDTKAGAEKREKQVQYFKHVKEDVEIVFLDENLHKWFKEKWVRFGPDGKIRGECARGSKGEGKPKCLPQAKAHAIGKKARKSAASKKRREDPNPERRGRAINVATKKKTNESVAEGNETENFVNKIMQAIQQYRKNMLTVYGEEAVRDAVIDAVDEYMSFKDDPELSEKFDVNDPYDLIYKADQIERDLRDWHRRDLQEEQLDELKCWSGYTRVKGVPAGAPGSCKKKSVKESHEQCPECGGPIFTDLLLAEEKDACYRKVKSRYKVWPSAYACVPEETSKALTRDGWKFVDDLSIGDEIMTFNMEKDILEFKPILNLHRYENAETTVIKSGNTGFIFECTPNHKWVVKFPAQKTDKIRKYEKINDMSLVEIKDLLEAKSNKHLVVSAEYNEGSPIKKDKIFKYGDNWVKYILDISPEQRQSWLFSAIVYDGNQVKTERLIEQNENIDDLDWKYSGNNGKQSFGFKQKDVEHRDAFLLAAFLNGGTVTWKEHVSKDIYSCYYVSNKRYKNLSNFKSINSNVTDVWCPETENGTWVMMQETNGKGIITITGNSGALVKCRKVGAANWGKSKKKKIAETISKDESKNFTKNISSKLGGGKIIAISEINNNNNQLSYYSIEYTNQNKKIKYEYKNGRKIWTDLSNPSGILLDEKTTIQSIKETFGKEVATIMLDFYGNNHITDDETLNRIKTMKESTDKNAVLKEIYEELKPAFDFLDWCALHTEEQPTNIKENYNTTQKFKNTTPPRNK